MPLQLCRPRTAHGIRSSIQRPLPPRPARLGVRRLHGLFRHHASAAREGTPFSRTTRRYSGAACPARSRIRLVADSNGLSALKPFPGTIPFSVLTARPHRRCGFVGTRRRMAFNGTISEPILIRSRSSIIPVFQSALESIGPNRAGFRRRCHLTVRIPPSQGGYTGSIPVSATKSRVIFLSL
jgi:hypothetical protein